MSEASSRLSESSWVVLLTLLLHTVFAALVPVPRFTKYPVAAELWLGEQLQVERLLDFSPLYLFLHRLASSWFGSAASSLFEGLQILLVAASCGALYWLLRRQAGRPVAALLVAAFAIDRHLLIYARTLEPEILQLALLIGFLVALERTRENPAGWSALAAGVLAALSLANRPTLLPVFLLTPVLLGLGQRRERLRSALLFALPVLLGLGLMAARSAHLVDDPRAPVMNPGTVFFEGNNPLSRGTSAVYPPLVSAALDSSRAQPDAPHQLYRDFARASTNRQLSVREVNTYWSSLARQFLLDHPGHAAQLWLHKLWLAFHGFLFHDLPTAWQMDLSLHWPSLPFPLFAGLAALGLWIDRRQWRRWWPLLAVAAVQMGVMVVFYVSARQRLPVLAVAVLLAAPALSWLGRAGWRARLAAGLSLGATTIVLCQPTAVIRDVLYQERGILQASERYRQLVQLTPNAPVGQHDRLAVEALARAPWHNERMRPAFLRQDQSSVDQRMLAWLAEQPEQDPSARFDQAVLALRTGDPRRAEQLLSSLQGITRPVYRRGHQSSAIGFYLAKAQLAANRQGAASLLRQTLSEHPGDPFVLAELVALGEGQYAAELQQYWSAVDGQYLLGRALLEHRRAQEAVAALQFVSRRLPELRRVRIFLAAALGEAGQLESGARLYLETVSRRGAVEPVLADRWIPDLFRRWQLKNPRRPDIRLYAAQVLRQYGYPHESLALLEGQPMPEPLRQATERELANIRRTLDEG